MGCIIEFLVTTLFSSASQADLEEALGADFNFEGRFAFSTPLPQAPNPGLFIDGLGLVGLPLSELYARYIKGISDQAPCGKGTKTLVNREVRDTWEIDAKRVSFTNPEWQKYIDGFVVETVWKALGVAANSSRPRCELHKLLLYETGSHFLPHQDTEKAKGMFATIIIILPSQYTGGQVHVTHGSLKEVFDFSSNSAFSTSLLARYTDVVHEVKPITSGYRLALSYNLIHTSRGVLPSPPNIDSAISTVRKNFSRWAGDRYYETGNMVIYLLSHQYSEANVKEGATALKGRDAHLIAQVRDVADETDVMLCLANIELYMTGSPDDHGDMYYHKRSRFESYGYDGYAGRRGRIPGMEQEYNRELSLKTVVDLNGERLLDDSTIRLSEEDSIPENAFDDVGDPDEVDYEGYQGNVKILFLLIRTND
ncbi:hypothetical protein HYDPIDRAFT_81166 [Hydnomerulius pinastri MD-312]|nr:hypothetical protein HYDPIDRAFT_81166 [Hydnomerulius pinastri MD-312]